MHGAPGRVSEGPCQGAVSYQPGMAKNASQEAIPPASRTRACTDMRGSRIRAVAPELCRACTRPEVLTCLTPQRCTYLTIVLDDSTPERVGCPDGWHPQDKDVARCSGHCPG